MAGSDAFPIDEAFRRLRKAVSGLPKAAMFDLRDRGFGSPFEQLAGSLISGRPPHQNTMAVCPRLFAVAKTPAEFVKLGETKLAKLLHGASFPEPKARDL